MTPDYLSEGWLLDLARGKKRHLIVDVDLDDLTLRTIVSREAQIVRKKPEQQKERV